MAYFLAKTDPETYSLDDLEREKRTSWDGVNNAQAVRAIREMRPGDRVFIYHSGGVSGVAASLMRHLLRRCPGLDCSDREPGRG